MNNWIEGSWLSNGDPDLKPMEDIDHVWVFVNAAKWSKPHAVHDPYFYLSTSRHAHEGYNPEAPPLRWWWMPCPMPDKPKV